jgi:hypothetical protein
MWVLVDMHKPAPGETTSCPPPPIIKDKQNEPPMNNRLSALVKCVAKHREDGLGVWHYVEEFYLR